MKLSSLAAPERVYPEVAGFDVATILRALARRLVDTSPIEAETEELYAKLWEREQLGSTGIGHGVAVPHCKMQRLDRVVLAIGRAVEPIDFAAVDGKPVQLFFTVVSPAKQPAAHLQCLAAISGWIKDEENVRRLLAAKSADEMVAVLTRTDPPDGGSQS